MLDYLTFSKLQHSYKHHDKWVQTRQKNLIPYIQTPVATVAMVWIQQIVLCINGGIILWYVYHYIMVKIRLVHASRFPPSPCPTVWMNGVGWLLIYGIHRVMHWCWSMMFNINVTSRSRKLNREKKYNFFLKKVKRKVWVRLITIFKVFLFKIRNMSRNKIFYLF